MNYYKFETKVENKFGVPTSVSYNDKIVSRSYYSDKITTKNLLLSNETINLSLDEIKGYSRTLLDYHRWELGRPKGYRLVCSPKYNSSLSKLDLPEYRFYDAEIDVKGQKHKYYVLHFIQEYLQDIDYKKSQFVETLLLEKNSVTKVCEIGEIKSEKHYHQFNKKLVEDMKYLQPKKIYFRPEINYDVWGLRGQIIISERAKRQIEKDQITGVEMINLKDTEMFKDLEVIFSNPDYGK